MGLIYLSYLLIKLVFVVLLKVLALYYYRCRRTLADAPKLKK